MWVEEMGVEIKCGLGWIPAIENFLEVVRAIEDYNGISNTVHSIKAISGDLQIDFSLPVCDSEEAILSTIMGEWTSRLCEICGHSGKFENDQVRCEKHKDSDPSVLSSVKTISEPGIPVFKKGAFVVCKTSGDGFWFADYRFPDRFLPPHETGSVVDQTESPFDILCDQELGRKKVLAAKYQEDMHLLFLDAESYNKLYPVSKPVIVKSYPQLNKLYMDGDELKKITRREAYRQYLKNHELIEIETMQPKERRFVKQLIQEFDVPEHHYVTGESALALAPPDKGIEAITRSRKTVIAGIHRQSTWSLLGDEGLYESREGVNRAGAILPRPLVADHERALFDELYDQIMGPHDAIMLNDCILDVVDIERVTTWISDSLIPGRKKLLMLKALKRFAGKVFE